MARVRSGVRVRTWAVTALLVLASVLGASPAHAAEGSIDFVEGKNGEIRVLYSTPEAQGAGDLDSVRLTLDGEELEATARPASDAQGSLRRRTILAIDVSNSMAGAKFTAARKAALVFLDSVPDDVEVGIVTFAGAVRVLQKPSLDRAASRRLVKGLELSLGTSLYDGVLRAVSTSGKTGGRSVLVLSDGRDTTRTPLSTVTTAIQAADIKVDVIALAQSANDERLLAPLSKAGKGSVISAADPKQLAQIFTSEAEALAGQVLVTASLGDLDASEGTVAVDMQVAGETFTDTAFVTIEAPAEKKAEPAAVSTTLQAPPAPWFEVTPKALLGVVLMLGSGLLVLLVVVFGGLQKEPESIESRIEAYTSKGGGPRRATDQTPTVAAQAVAVAQKALQGNRGFEARLGAKLDAGGLSLKPAEWLLMHAGIAFAGTALVFVLTSGDLLFTGLAFLGGILLPWLYLGHKQSRRLKAFNSQLAATLQLLAGSLQAGLSIGQGMDTIVREGAEPVAGEFRRALVETRLGVQIEDALDSIAGRMMSDDFKWTVMAIRIQREVGGNLAELLLNVAATLRERDYLRRQVKSLSAEGRFSAYILLALPPGVMVFMYMTNREYLAPLIETPMGWVMLGAMGLLMSVGAFMMSRMVKLEV